MRVSDILSLSSEQIKGLSEKELRSYINITNAVATKRIKRLREYVEKHPNLPTPQILRGDSPWTEETFLLKNRNDSRKMRIQLEGNIFFLTSKTGSIEHYKKSLIEFQYELVKRAKGVEDDENLIKEVKKSFKNIDMDRFWRVYHELDVKYHLEKGDSKTLSSKQAQKMLYETMSEDNKSFSDLFFEIENKLLGKKVEENIEQEKDIIKKSSRIKGMGKI